MKRVSTILVSIFSAVGIAVAATAMSASTSALPPEQVQGSVSYLSGGIGLDESNAIKQAASQYSLELEFVRKATPKAEYLSNIKVTIKDNAGKTVLETMSNGPFLLAKLPAGQFTVTAERGGEAKQRMVNIKAKGHERVMFVWQ
ncbi:MAG: carboxypeptidase regulatory-like domain-containing protein [Betaproteobacteria bacterium]|nr:MAG: carboxypeptidase regulatory-like domain-containing protein [Betaproteobacteria bacterium]